MGAVGGGRRGGVAITGMIVAFTKHITDALIKAREEKLQLETSIPRKLQDGWETNIKMKINDFDCNGLCDLGASVPVMAKSFYDMLNLKPLEEYYLSVHLADSSKKKPLGRIDDVLLLTTIIMFPLILLSWTLSVMFLVLLFWEDRFLELLVLLLI